jgi:hypothetical protein
MHSIHNSTAIPIIIEGRFQVFQRFSSSKLVLKTVESCFAALNYYGNGSTRRTGRLVVCISMFCIEDKSVAPHRCLKRKYVYMYVCLCVCMYAHACAYSSSCRQIRRSTQESAKYVYMYLCVSVCMYVCMHTRMHIVSLVDKSVAPHCDRSLQSMFVCIYVCLYVCMYVCMYVCTRVCI